MGWLKTLFIVLVAAVGVVNVVVYGGVLGNNENGIIPSGFLQTPELQVAEANGENLAAYSDIAQEAVDVPASDASETEPEPVIEPEFDPEPESDLEPEIEPEPEPELEPVITKTWLTELRPFFHTVSPEFEVINRTADVTDAFGDPIGETDRKLFSRSHVGGNALARFYLQGRYSWLEATWSAGEFLVSLEIFADGEMIYSATSSSEELIPISLDIGNCDILEFSFSGPNVTVHDPILISNPDFVQPVSVFDMTGVSQWLANIEPVSQDRNFRITRQPGISNTHEAFSNSLSLREQSPGSAEWALDGQFTRLRGVFTLTRSNWEGQWAGSWWETWSFGGVLRIYLDGERVYESPHLRGGSLPIPVDIDVTGAETLTIRIANDARITSVINYSYHGSPALANAALFR